MILIFWVLIFAGKVLCAFSEYRLEDDVQKGRPKRYVVSKKRWNFNAFSWKLHANNINEADRFVIRSTLHRAFSLWSDASELKFVEIPVESQMPADLSISFLRGRHGDNLPFDGPEGVVAHAFYPTIGVLHFDADENWTLNQADGINLFQTAVHEIGHLLGLEHSTDHRAVMFPKNRPYNSNYELADDDVRGIRKLFPPAKRPQMDQLLSDFSIRPFKSTKLRRVSVLRDLKRIIS